LVCCSFSMVLRIELMVLCILGKCSTTELQHQPSHSNAHKMISFIYYFLYYTLRNTVLNSEIYIPFIRYCAKRFSI
jgi:hypothetical protein